MEMPGCMITLSGTRWTWDDHISGGDITGATTLPLGIVIHLDDNSNQKMKQLKPFLTLVHRTVCSSFTNMKKHFQDCIQFIHISPSSPFPNPPPPSPFPLQTAPWRHVQQLMMCLSQVITCSSLPSSLASSHLISLFTVQNSCSVI